MLYSVFSMIMLIKDFIIVLLYVIITFSVTRLTDF